MIFSFAWNGILFGIISLGRVEKIIMLAWGKNFSFLFGRRHRGYDNTPS
jgi:hypothetical protein